MISLARYAVENGGTDTNIPVPNRILRHGFSAGNTTCVKLDGELIFNTRLVDYRKIVQGEDRRFIWAKLNQTGFYGAKTFSSRNITYRLADGKISGAKETDYGSGHGNVLYLGFEDCRLIVWDGTLYAYGTRWDTGDGIGHMCLYQLDSGFNPVRMTVIQSPFGSECEKNWAAVEGKPFHFIYQYSPMVIVRVSDLDSGECEVVRNDSEPYAVPDGRFIKGSSQVVRLDSERYISVVHSTPISVGRDGFRNLRYHSAFVMLDNNLDIIRITDWFVFRTDLCEFTCGLAVDGDTVTIPYSQLDCTVNVLEIGKDDIMRLFDGGVGDFPLYGFGYIHGLARQYERMEQTQTATVLYNYAAVLCEGTGDLFLECAAKGLCGIVRDVSEIMPGSEYLGLVRGCIERMIVDCGKGMWLYFPLSEICRAQGDIRSAERYAEIGIGQCGDNIKISDYLY